MVQVQLNGEDAPIRADGCSELTQIVELVKAVIDPNHMITGILLDGEPLDDSDWTKPVSRLETSIIEVETGSPEDFVGERLAKAPDIVRSCFFEFRAARQQFQDGRSTEGNRQLLQAVEALQAFFQWYGTLLELMPEDRRTDYDITEMVEELSVICKGICQHQLYQSWWALGEALQTRLEPQLDALEGRCRQFGQYTTAA